VRSYTKPLRGGSVVVSAGPRGQLIAVADGPNKMGFWICDWCGHGSQRVKNPQKPPKHNHLLKNQPCSGPQRLLDLAHSYETDLLSVDVDVFGIRPTKSAWLSAMYAIVEAASETLEIAREDIGGSLTPAGADRWSITLFDAVPGGAGHVLQVEQNLERVMQVALRRVSECECGPETSCYGCLRSYQNQRDHDYLSRGDAEQVLRRLVENEGVVHVQITEHAVPDSLPLDWMEAYRSAVGSEREMVLALAEAGVVRPELGFESAGGIPISIAWPDRLIACEFGLETADRAELEAEGWTVLSLEELSAQLVGAGGRS
jgi:hypothetical protein